MPYNLFIDDERFPADNGKDWIIARTLDDVKEIVEQRGLPLEISWDHDLGENQPTGFDIAKWMVDQELADLHRFPDGFSFYVHSQNPIGKANIENYFFNYFRVR
jgi:hypothetical protein